MLSTSVHIGLALRPALETPSRQDSPQSNFWVPASPSPIRRSDVPAGLLVGRTLADVERHLILATLSHCLGNSTHAAKLLGISIRTLRNKLSEYTEAGFAVPEAGQKSSQVS